MITQQLSMSHFKRQKNITNASTLCELHCVHRTVSSITLKIFKKIGNAFSMLKDI